MVDTPTKSSDTPSAWIPIAISSIAAFIALASAITALLSYLTSRRALAVNAKNLAASHWEVTLKEPCTVFMQPTRFSVAATNAARAAVQVWSARLQIPGSDRLFFEPDEPIPFLLEGGHRQQLTFKYEFSSNIETIIGRLHITLGDGSSQSYAVRVPPAAAEDDKPSTMTPKGRIKRAEELFGPAIKDSDELRAKCPNRYTLNKDGTTTRIAGESDSDEEN
jgi:hypothetical protein